MIESSAPRPFGPRVAGARAGRDRRYLAGLAVILGAAAVLRLHGLGAQAFDCDELYAVRIGATSWRELASVLGRVAFHEPHPPLSSLGFAVWVALVGPGEVAVRSLPALLGILGVALVAAVGRRLAGPAAGLAAAAFFALNPLQVAYAQEARPYALAVALVLAAHLLFLRCLAGGHRRDLAVYALVATAAVYSHYFAAFALLPHGVAALWIALTAGRPARAAAAATLLAFGASLATLVAWTPALLFQLRVEAGGAELGSHRVVGARQVGSWLAEVGGLGTPPLLLLATLAAAVLVAAALGARGPLALASEGEARPPLPRRAGSVALVAALPLGLLLAIAVRRAAPLAREVLANHGYGPAAIDGELRAMGQFALSVPIALAALGVGLLCWDALCGALDRAARRSQGRGRVPAQGVLLALLLVVPLLGVAVPGALGAPIFSSRNLLLFQPALALALGLGATRLGRTRPGRVALAPLLLCLAAAALQYEPISRVLGMPGIATGKRAARWRDLDRALAAAPDPGGGLILADAPNTDPAVFYLPSHGVTRVERPAELAALPSLPGARFVHLVGDRRSEALLAALSERRALRARIRVDELVVYELRARAAGAGTPGVKIPPRRAALPPTPPPQQGGLPP